MQLKWESAITSRAYYEMGVYRARAVDDSHKQEQLIQDISDRLHDDKSRGKAAELLDALLKIDDMVKPETKFLERVKTVFGFGTGLKLRTELNLSDSKVSQLH